MTAAALIETTLGPFIVEDLSYCRLDTISFGTIQIHVRL